MPDLALSFKELPPEVIEDVLAALQGAYRRSDVTAGVVLFNNSRGAVVGEITVKADETSLSATVTALDAEGHETTFDETPTWESSDESVATVAPSADGYSATFEIGAPGAAVITVRGIENASGENVEVVSTGLINVTAGDAVVGSVEFSVPGE